MSDSSPQQLASSVAAAARAAPVARWTAPSNLSVEKARVLDAVANGQRVAVPAFRYVALPESPAEPWVELARQLASSTDIVAARVHRHAVAQIEQIEAIAARDGDGLTAASLRSYGRPTAETIDVARGRLDELTVDAIADEPASWVKTEAAIEVFRSTLDALGLDRWSVVVQDEMNARAAVSSANREVRLRRGEDLLRTTVARLLVHEIGTHVIRAANGAAQPTPVLAHGLTGYLATEEGLAVHHEHTYGSPPDIATQRRYAVRAIAAERTLEVGFVELFEELLDLTSPDEAFDIAARAKRGLSDVAAPGGNTKDHVYLSGYLEVSSHLAATPEDHAWLLAGKIALEDLDLLKQLAAEGRVSVEGLLHPASITPLDAVMRSS